MKKKIIIIGIIVGLLAVSATFMYPLSTGSVTACFSINDTVFNMGDTIILNAACSVNTDEYRWNIGSGWTSWYPFETFSVTLDEPGVHEFFLEVRNFGGFTDSYSKSIVVNEDITYVTCYRCVGYELESEVYQTFCPYGWSETIPNCGGDMVSCWKCEGENPLVKTFDYGTVCGQGSASEYPFISEPDCEPDIYTVEILVLDGAYYINNAEVTFNSEVKNTDSSGKVSFEVTPGEYNLIVNKIGYETHNSIVSINENKLVPVTLTPDFTDESPGFGIAILLIGLLILIYKKRE